MDIFKGSTIAQTCLHSLVFCYRLSYKETGTTEEDPGERLSGRKRAECISISFSRLLLAKMIVVVVILKVTTLGYCNSERGSITENNIVRGTLPRFLLRLSLLLSLLRV